MSKKNAFRKRFDFSKIPATIQIPNLIEVQKRSYDRFLQMDSCRASVRTAVYSPYFSRCFQLPTSATSPNSSSSISRSATGSVSADT